jgi:Phosphotransferase enzyme family
MGRSIYAQKLQDAAFWQPYVDQVLRRHNLPRGQAVVGEIGTFPTFLVGSSVIKFFGEWFDGAECFEIERSLYSSTLPMLCAVNVPRLLAHGQLFETGWPWPYIVTTRLEGTAWSQITIRPVDWKPVVASELGLALHEVHHLDCPDEPVWQRDVLSALRATCATRHRTWQVLPEFLIEQIDEYLTPPSTECCLVHADLHENHIFVRDGHLAGIIDWGDALCCDPYYDLPSLFFLTFGGEKSLLRTFLEAYDWPTTKDFVHRAMTMTLVHEFNPLGAAPLSLDGVRTLHDLAASLWEL